MGNIIGIAVLVAAAALCVWAGVRALRSRYPVVRWGGVGVAGGLATALVLTSGVAIVGLYWQDARSAPVPDLSVAGSPEQIRRGRAIADSFCAACHSRTGTLTGGVDIGKHLPLNVGVFISANLTPAGPLRHWSDGQILRAVRNAVDADGRWLMIMSYTNAGKLSDTDVEALIAYIRTVPPAGPVAAAPLDRLNPVGLLMLGAGLLPRGKPVFTGVVTAPAKGPDAAYGAYLLSYNDCRECHGAHLTGGVPGQWAPVGPDLSIVTQWRREQFVATLRTGTDPYGHELSDRMPWRSYAKLDDQELAAIYAYLVKMPGLQAAEARD